MPAPAAGEGGEGGGGGTPGDVLGRLPRVVVCPIVLPPNQILDVGANDPGSDQRPAKRMKEGLVREAQRRSCERERGREGRSEKGGSRAGGPQL